MAINRLIETAGGYNNPALNLNFVPDLATADQNALLTQQGRQVNQLRGQQIADYPEERNYLRQQRADAATDRQTTNARASDLFLRAAVPTFGDLKWLKSPSGRQRLEGEMGVTGLPTDEEIAEQAPEYGGEEQAWQAWKARYMEAPEAGKAKWSAPREGVDEAGNPIVYRVNKDTGEPQIIKGVGPKPTKGMKVYDNKGNLILDTSGGQGPDITTKEKGRIEGKLIDGSEQLSRMLSIYDKWKPEYNEVGTRFQAAWTGTKAFLGQPVEEKDRELLTEFKTFQRKSIENINLYIKELTGAQMSEKEADRLRLAMPDPGEKWWQGDDPITFKAKMDDVIKTTRASIARWNYYRSKGIGEKQIEEMINEGRALSLDSMIERM